MIHIPVLVEEVINYLDPKRGGTYIDATLGGGGHARAVLDATGGAGTVLGIERDPKLVKIMRGNAPHNLIIVEGNYKDMEYIAQQHRKTVIDGVLFDFGMSSWHLHESRRGFSFLKDEPLDMRYNDTQGKSAAELINSLGYRDLERIMQDSGEGRYARRIARAIVSARKKHRIVTSREFTDIIGAHAPRRSHIHPATKIFQALRIAVNDELANVRDGIAAAMRIVRRGGRVVAISFHSQEDAVVKRAFREYGKALTKKVITPSRQEVLANPRARSARLRAWEKSAS